MSKASWAWKPFHKGPLFKSNKTKHEARCRAEVSLAEAKIKEDQKKRLLCNALFLQNALTNAEIHEQGLASPCQPTDFCAEAVIALQAVAPFCGKVNDLKKHIRQKTMVPATMEKLLLMLQHRLLHVNETYPYPKTRKRRRLVAYYEPLGGVGKAKDSAEVDEVDKDADEEVSEENAGRVAGALDDIPDDDIIPDETSDNTTREGVPAELGEEVAAAVRTTQISLHFGRTAEVFKLEEIFDMQRLDDKSPWGGSLMSYALDGKRTLEDLLAEFEEDAPGAPDEDAVMVE
ncbi:hypothetical protein B0H13DRAFT_1855084 [Mycena leptocephala]|nr:hypothetical protein B0H13DRAFT_1855084 [Mycena leptocephala]